MIYFGIFSKDSEGYYTVVFPDVPGAITEGKDLEEAIDMASDALGAALADSQIKDWPKSGAHAQIESQAEGNRVYPISPSLHALREHQPKTRINIMVPVPLLEDLNKKVNPRGRSAFITEAIENSLYDSKLP